MKNDFINNMTHEFKTPISTISLAAQMLKDPAVGKSPTMFQHISGVINDETIPAADIAEEAGNVKSANVVMLGALCRLCGMDKEKMAQAISDCVPEKFRDVNLKAFALGYERVK